VNQERLGNMTQEKMNHTDDARGLVRLLQSARSYILAPTARAEEDSGEGHRVRRTRYEVRGVEAGYGRHPESIAAKCDRDGRPALTASRANETLRPNRVGRYRRWGKGRR
jgi:hypothetical protein